MGFLNGCISSVHPRVCGEQVVPYYQSRDYIGSSPRVRGTANQGRWRLSALRFIPACAGNSLDPIVNIGSASVHPRVCGEQ